MEPKNILIFPAGTEIAFEIFNALKYSKFVNLYGGTSVDDHSQFVYKNIITGFPYIDDNGFVEFLNQKIHEYNINCIFPAHDSVSVILSKYADKIDAQVIMTEYNTVKICRSKYDTYEFFKDMSFVPKTYQKDEIEEFPVFVKPAVGQGSKGAKIINSREELISALNKGEQLVVCEYLPGMEYTVDCFTDRYGKLRVIKLRNRERIKAGISVKSREIVVDQQVIDIAEKINERLNFRGAWFFQLKKNKDNEYRLMEISPRIPGTMGLSRNLGINFPMLTLFDFWGIDVDIIDNEYDIVLDRAFYSAYSIDIEYEHVYLDYDDTIIIDGRVNNEIMAFIYQAINENKKIHIISKHENDLLIDLKKYRIAENLFESIVVIDKNDEKKNYITERRSIFIDDSFAERKSVSEALGIPVFDLDMIESLINYRV